MQKYHDHILFTPGPVSVSPRVLAAGSKPMIHHRTPEFHILLDNVIDKLKILFGTSADVLVVHGTGRSSMEGALRNLFSPGDKIVSICNGRFGEMFAEIGEACDLEVRRIFEDWLQPVDIEKIDLMLRNDPDIRGITVVHSDTSTAVENPIKDIGDIVRKYERLLIVDCISSLGVMEFKMDEWKVDAAVTASQKGLMAPTGISFAAVNQRGWTAIENSGKPGYAINFKKIRDFFHDKHETFASTPVSLLSSVNESLEMIFEEGLENVYKRHAVISQTIKSCVQAMGLALLPEGNVKRSHAVTLVQAPATITPSRIKEMARDQYGVLLATGLGNLKEKAIRIGHIGMISPREALLIVSVLELILFELGIMQQLGKGLEAYYATIKNIREKGT